MKSPDFPWYPQAPSLPTPTGRIVRAASSADLYRAAEDAKPGDTILVEEGAYRLDRTLVLRADRVTLRGASGRRDRVVLDGGGVLGEGISIFRSSGVTIADLTLRNVRWNGIKINSETGVHRVTIRNCILNNIWQRAIKGVIVPPENRDVNRPTGCVVEYCLIYNDRPKRFTDDPADTPENFDGNYIGGIDIMYARRWSIRDNVFVGLRGRTGSARGAIFIWQDSMDCTIERNTIVDCDSGICLGNSHRGEPDQIHCRRFMVRNNFVTRAPENGILADYTLDCMLLHNTVHDPDSRLGRLIRIVHDADGLVVKNNLLSGPDPRIETDSRILLEGNLSRDMTPGFVDPRNGNLRLTKAAVEAIDKAAPLPEVRDDIDRKPRGAKPDIGASEWKPLKGKQ